MSWSVRLIKPVTPAKGKPIVTISDARAYILALPAAEQETEVVQATAEAILMAAQGRGPVFTAQAGIAQMVHGPIQIGEAATGKQRHWRSRR